MVIWSKQGKIAWYLFPSLNWNLVHIYKGWKLTHYKFTTWLITSRQKREVLCMFSSYPSSNIQWFWSFFVVFFNCYLAALRPTMDHSQGDSLTNPMLITAFELFWPECYREPHNKVGHLSPGKCLMSFEPGTFRF